MKLRPLLLVLVTACAVEPAAPLPDVADTALEVIAQRELAARGLDSATSWRSGPRHVRTALSGLPIWGLDGKIVGDRIHYPNVRLAPGVPAPAAARISDVTALAVALAELDDATARPLSSELVLLPREELRLVGPVPPSREPDATDYQRVITAWTPVHRLELTSGPDGDRRFFIAVIDAVTGEVIDLSSTTVFADERRTAVGKGWYSGQRTIDVEFTDIYQEDEYRLVDLYGNRYRYHAGEKGSYPYDGPDAAFGDGRPFKQTSWPNSANGETAAVDAYYAVDVTWRFFVEVFRRRGPSGSNRPLDIILHYPIDNAGYIFSRPNPQVIIGYRYLFADAHGNRAPMSTLDIVAHELGHDYYVSELFDDPATAPSDRSEFKGMGEASSDMIGMLVQMYRDVRALGRAPSAMDGLAPLPEYLQGGEQTGYPTGNILDPTHYEWFPGIGLEEQHEAGGPMGRMFALLAFGCAPIDAGTTVLSPFNCARLPKGFPGIGAYSAAVLWNSTVKTLSTAPDFAEARQRAMSAAFFAENVFGGPKQRAVADAFAAINVGQPADRRSPTATLSCSQVIDGIRCSGTVADAENPDQFNRLPDLVLDSVKTYTQQGWTIDFVIPRADLTHGNRRVELRAWDLWGNPVVRSSVVAYDKLGPTVAVTRTGLLPKRPTLQVSASDPSGVVEVSFHEGNVLLADVSLGTWELSLDTSTWSDGDHPITVRTTDGFDNVASAQIVVRADNTRPGVSVAIVDDGTPPFAVTATVSDASPIDRVDFKIDSLLIASRTAPPYTASYTPIDGLAHNLRVEATDAFGNVGSQSTAAPRDLAPPSLTFSATQSGTVVSINTTVADSCGIETPYAFFVDGVQVAQPTTPGYVLLLGTLADGVHAFQALVRDRCGNLNNFVTTFVKTSNAPPVITGITRDDAQPKKPKFTVACVDDVGVHHVEMRIDGAVVASDSSAPYQFVVDTTTWPDGDETVLFHCSDTDGLASAPETRTVTADNTGPTFTLSVGAAGRDHVITAENVSDPRGIEKVTLRGGLVFPTFTFVDLAAPYTFTWHIEGTATIQTIFPFAADAVDRWGNVRSSLLWCNVDTNHTQWHVLACDAE